MLKTIEQSVGFAVSPRELYDIYMDPVRHARLTGAPVRISAKPGSRFKAFDGMLSGVTLAAIPGRLIVQRWRSCEFKATDMDSVLVLSFVQDGKHGRIDLVHVNVPTHDYADVKSGWTKYYWKPLKVYLKLRGK